MAQDELWCLDGEEWRDVVGYEGLYQVSQYARIRSVDRTRIDKSGRTHNYHGRILNQYGTTTHNTRLTRDGVGTNFRVDWLVASAFVANPDGFPDVLHIDNDTSNDNADNLRWGHHDTCYVYDHDSNEAEEWRDIVGYEGLYSVSNLGRVRSNEIDMFVKTGPGTGYTKTRKEHIMRPRLNPSGYPVVTLHDADGNVKYARVHRLVAEAFVDNPNNLPVVDHINAIRNDARAENLRWVTDKENVHHAIEMGNFDPSRISKESLTEERIQHIREAASKPVIRDDGIVYASQLEAGRALGYKDGCSIYKVIHGLIKSCRGHTFQYVACE